MGMVWGIPSSFCQVDSKPAPLNSLSSRLYFFDSRRVYHFQGKTSEDNLKCEVPPVATMPIFRPDESQTVPMPSAQIDTTVHYTIQVKRVGKKIKRVGKKKL